MTTPHKHQALIVAWAAGAEIEFFSTLDEWTWRATDRPGWNPDTEYRVKPAAKPNVVTWHSVDVEGYIYGALSARDKVDANDDITLPIAVLRIEIDHNTTPPTLVSATLEAP